MKTTAWDGTAEEFWKAVRATRDNADVEGDAAVLSEVLEIAERSVRYWHQSPGPGARPDTIEKCHALIEGLDVEIHGAVVDYLRAREWAVKQIRSGNRAIGESLLKAMRGES